MQKKLIGMILACVAFGASAADTLYKCLDRSGQAIFTRAPTEDLLNCTVAGQPPQQTDTSPPRAATTTVAILGTHWVKFQQVQAGSELQGCSLVFLAVQEDRAYLDGNHVAVSGSINVRSAPDAAILLGLKVGLRNITRGSPYERPASNRQKSASHWFLTIGN